MSILDSWIKLKFLLNFNKNLGGDPTAGSPTVTL